MTDAVLKQFEHPDDVRRFEKGKIELVQVGGLTIGKASYEPGWKWSEHVAPLVGTALCQVEHVGMVVSGHAVAQMQDGTIVDLLPGNLFYIGPGHDSWVEGDEPYVSLHFHGADRYGVPD